MNSQISISEAARRWGVDRKTIQRRIKEGALSLVQRDAGAKNQAKLIEIVELIRVFGEPNNSESKQGAGEGAEEMGNLTQGNSAAKEQHIKALNEEIEFLRGQVEFLQKQLAKRDEFEQKLLTSQGEKKGFFRRIFN